MQKIAINFLIFYLKKKKHELLALFSKKILSINLKIWDGNKGNLPEKIECVSETKYSLNVEDFPFINSEIAY